MTASIITGDPLFDVPAAICIGVVIGGLMIISFIAGMAVGKKQARITPPTPEDAEFWEALKIEKAKSVD